MDLVVILEPSRKLDQDALNVRAVMDVHGIAIEVFTNASAMLLPLGLLTGVNRQPCPAQYEWDAPPKRQKARLISQPGIWF